MISIAMFTAAALTMEPARNMTPPSSMMAWRPIFLVTLLATKDDRAPARNSDDENAVSHWLSYLQYRLLLGLFLPLCTSGKNLLRNESICVTPPDLPNVHLRKRKMFLPHGCSTDMLVVIVSS
jgi:hypothetical protein